MEDSDVEDLQEVQVGKVDLDPVTRAVCKSQPGVCGKCQHLGVAPIAQESVFRLS